MGRGNAFNDWLFRRGFQIAPAARLDAVRQVMRRARPVAIREPLIRLGGPGDGGYLVPDVLDGLAACFSPGVADSADFEEALADGHGLPCYLADFSVDAAPVAHPLFHFEQKFLGDRTDDRHMRLADWITRNRPDAGDLLLQMDIEGAEYPVLLDTPPEVLRRFRIIVAEFHTCEMIFTRDGLRLFDAVLSRLLPIFDVVHIHPNNYYQPVRVLDLAVPPLMEFTFARKDSVTRTGAAPQIPHALDADNVEGKPPAPLPDCWWRDG